MSNVQRPNPVRGFLASVGVTPPVLVRFQYNPERVSDKRSVSYATLSAPGMLTPVRQYTSGGERALSFTVMVDGLFEGPADATIDLLRDDRGGIGPELAKYRAFTYPRTGRWQEASGAADGFMGLYDDATPTFAAPPTCRFGFGERVLDCVVTEVAITELLFNQTLDPVRAEVSVSLVELSRHSAEPATGGAA